MPKRKMTPARKAAIAKWQKAGAKARKGKRAKPVEKSYGHNEEYITSNFRTPYGKNRLLVHRTTPANAKKILKEGFKGNMVWFTNPHDAKVWGWKSHGSAIVGVVVSKKLTPGHPTQRRLNKPFGPEAIPIQSHNLTGVKVRRIK